MLYFFKKFIKQIDISSTPEEDNGFDYDDSYHTLKDDNTQNVFPDADLVKIDELIENLTQLKEMGANYVACDWHCDHQELELYGFQFGKATPDQINQYLDKTEKKEDLSKQEKIDRLQKELDELLNN